MHLLGVMKMIDDLSMAHDNLHRELADIKRLIGKDKHALIKSNISLNKKVQELESKVKQLNREALTLNSIKKRYKEALDIIVVHADDPDAVRDIYSELVIKMDRLEGEE